MKICFNWELASLFYNQHFSQKIPKKIRNFCPLINPKKIPEFLRFPSQNRRPIILIKVSIGKES